MCHFDTQFPSMSRLMDRGGSGGSNTGLEMPIECVGSE